MVVVDRADEVAVYPFESLDADKHGPDEQHAEQAQAEKESGTDRQITERPRHTRTVPGRGRGIRLI
jgi:hypothetical protein